MAPEDVILLKLIANRRKDLADVENILAVYSGIDADYLRHWATKLDIVPQLREFLP